MERRIVAQLLTCMDDLNSAVSVAGEGAEDATPGIEEGGANQQLAKGKRAAHVVVIGATNRPDSLDPALRRAGRFDREIALGIPDEDARARILEVMARKLRLEGSFNFKRIARGTPGFVGADLAALTKEAAAVAVKRIFSSLGQEHSATENGRCADSHARDGGGNSELEENPKGVEMSLAVEDREGKNPPACADLASGMGSFLWKRTFTREEMGGLSITMEDFEEAVGKVQPSAKREGFATIPDVTWEDVGSLSEVREELEFSVSRPIKFPEQYQAMGLEMASGVLLFGPPGCGKTLVAKAIARDAGANFISIKGPELLNKYVGESERAVRQLFMRARASAPCVLFFDEMDAMAPRRGTDGNAAAERVVNQLLTEMDGLEQRKSVFLIAATNRPDMIDPAMLRPGRLDKLLYVPLPDAPGRAEILGTLMRRTPVACDVDARAIAVGERCERFSGADLAALVREACIASLRERTGAVSRRARDAPEEDGSAMTGAPPLVHNRHFEEAFQRVGPSVSLQDQRRYDQMRQKLRRARGHISKESTHMDNDESMAIGGKEPEEGRGLAATQ